MPPRNPRPDSEYQQIAEQWKRAQRVRDAEKAGGDARAEQKRKATQQQQLEAHAQRRKSAYERKWVYTWAFWLWMLCLHAIGIYLFTSGFMLTRLVLGDASTCEGPPVDILGKWEGKGTPEGGCWHPRTFKRAVVILIDALRYDFTVPVATDDEGMGTAEIYHNAFPFLYQSAVQSPSNAFLLPFIADPPTATLQRLKGLTTGTLPTFMDLGSNFAGTEIDEDSLLSQMRGAGRKMVHLGDDTWWSLFPGYFDSERSRAYDSFNVWDLHTVDDGVIEHIFPLLEADEEHKDWGLLIGHCLGVDHAGHRYGPNHPAMAAKLRQMDDFVRNLTQVIDEDTLLVVMGDHGMDAKGDHGGESDDEVEAALWMYSKRPQFGRTALAYNVPPATAKIRPVNQIDLVPTLALLLGLPIPYNSLGAPIAEAFIGAEGNNWANMAAASKVSAAGVRRYQSSYFAARGIGGDGAAVPQDVGTGTGTLAGSRDAIFARAEADVHGQDWPAAVEGFSAYQASTLATCKALWARFDVAKMATGIAVFAGGVLVLLLYVTGGHWQEEEDEEDDTKPATGAPETVLATVAKESRYQAFARKLLLGIVPGAVLGAGLTASLRVLLDATRLSDLDAAYLAAGAAAGSMLGALPQLLSAKSLRRMLPTSPWTWLAVTFTLLQSIGFASNSYTIWEDAILLFFISTFGAACAVAALRVQDRAKRYTAVAQAVVFILLTRVASFSRLCREEQMPYCTSTFYASANSTTSATWQLAIPVIVAVALPAVVKSFMAATNSYEGLAPAWVGGGLRAALAATAGYWLLDAADNGAWLEGMAGSAVLKTVQVYTAQTVLLAAVVVGGVTFAYAPPCIRILSGGPGAGGTGAKAGVVPVAGVSNVHGARYLLLVVSVLAACAVLSKPMGIASLAAFAWQVLLVPELLELAGLRGSVIGPVVYAVLGNYYFFKTGHQAVLSSIQWDSAFIPLFAVRYPWSPLFVALNTFAGQVLAVAAVPLTALWRAGPRRRVGGTGTLEGVSRALGAVVAYYAVETLATMMWAGHLRRHLMLYRVFNPRFMTAAAVLLLVDVVGVLLTLPGVRANTLAVMFVFDWIWAD